MVAEASRDVIINLRYVLDKGSMADVRTAGKEAITIQDQIRKATEQSAAGQAAANKRGLDAQEKEQLKYGAWLSRQYDKRLKDAERLAKANEKFDADFVKKGIANAERMEKARQRAAEQSAAGIAAAQAKTEAGYRKSAESLVQLGRGIGQLGLVGEQNMQKFLSTLVKIEGAANVAKGAMGLTSGLNQVGTLGSLGLAGAGSAGAGAGLGSVAAAATAAAAALAMVAVMGKELAEGSYNKPGSFWMKSANFSADADQWMRNTIPGAKYAPDPYGSDDRTRLEKRSADMEKELRNRRGATAILEEEEQRRRAESAQRNELRGLRVNAHVASAAAMGADDREQQQMRVGDAKFGVAAAASRLAAAERSDMPALESTLARLRNESAQATARAAAEEKTLAQIIREESGIKLDEARKSRDAHMGALQAAESRFAAEKRGYQSFQENFLELDPVKQRQAAEAARKAQLGEDLTDSDRKILKESNFGSINEGVQQGFDANTQKRFEALGVGDLTAGFRERMERMQQGIEAEREDAISFVQSVNEIEKMYREGNQRLREAVAKAAEEQVAAYKAGIDDAKANAEANAMVRMAGAP